VNEGGAAVLPWQVIRDDDNGNRYRVAWYATRDEAQRMAESLDGHDAGPVYSVERLERNAS
jgi:hypothetical protein